MEEGVRGIGLLGGSFDPVHNGHLSIAQSFLQSKYISELWILLAPDPPHKTHSLSPYEIRLRMLEVAFKEMDNVCVNEIEKKLPYPSYTVQTVKHLREEHPDNNFFLCIGEDSAISFTDWYRWQDILECCELLIAKRPDTKNSELHEMVAKKSHFVSHQPVDISSTKIRNRVMRGKDVSAMLPPGTEEIIEKEGLYKK